MPTATSPPLVETETFTRAGIPILVLCCAIGAVCALDRVVLSIAILPMSAEMGYSDSTKGLIASAFSWGYALGLLPAGTLSAISSPKAVLGGGLVVWSLAQAATPMAAASSLPALLAARAAMGVGEAAAIPCIQSIAANFVPARYRSQFCGVLTASLSLGTISAYTISPLLIDEYGWPSSFITYGGVGCVLAIAWLALGQSSPAEADECVPDACDPGFESEPASPWERVAEVPWQDVVSSRAVWALTAAHSAANFYNYFALAWLPTYFSYQFSLSTKESSAASLLPFVAGAVGGLSAGFACDTLVNRTGIPLTRARKLTQTVAFVGPAVTLSALAVLGSGTAGMQLDRDTAEALFIIGVGCQAWSAGGWGCCTQDISKRYASLIYGATSVFAVLTGASGQYFTGWLLEQTGRDFTLSERTLDLERTCASRKPTRNVAAASPCTARPLSPATLWQCLRSPRPWSSLDCARTGRGGTRSGCLSNQGILAARSTLAGWEGSVLSWQRASRPVDGTEADDQCGIRDPRHVVSHNTGTCGLTLSDGREAPRRASGGSAARRLVAVTCCLNNPTWRGAVFFPSSVRSPIYSVKCHAMAEMAKTPEGDRFNAPGAA